MTAEKLDWNHKIKEAKDACKKNCKGEKHASEELAKKMIAKVWVHNDRKKHSELQKSKTRDAQAA